MIYDFGYSTWDDYLYEKYETFEDYVNSLDRNKVVSSSEWRVTTATTYSNTTVAYGYRINEDGTIETTLYPIKKPQLTGKWNPITGFSWRYI